MFGRKRKLDDFSAEIEAHLQLESERLREQGLSEEEARTVARRTFGNLTLAQERFYESGRWLWWDHFWQDLRYGLRMLRRSPGFSVVAVLTLTLGIGANTVLFSVANGVLLNPLPFPQPQQLVSLYESKMNFEKSSITYPNFLDWQRENHSFTEMAGHRLTNFSLTGTGEAERVKAAMISAGFFSILGVKPLAGRLFVPDEDRLGGQPVVLIGEGFWRRKFGSAARIIGRPLILDGTAHTVVGIIPSSFHLQMFNFRVADVYTPIGQWNYDLFRGRATAQGMDAIARLKPGVTLEQARADLDGITRQLALTYPQADKGVGANITPLKQAEVEGVEPLLLLLLGAVGFVLLIACVNVASLLLARSASRKREFAVRAALGASKGRSIRQLVTESLLLALAGGSVGVLFASWGVQRALALAGTLDPSGMPRGEEVSIVTSCSSPPGSHFSSASSLDLRPRSKSRIRTCGTRCKEVAAAQQPAPEACVRSL
jgi:predicted permease